MRTVSEQALPLDAPFSVMREPHWLCGQVAHFLAWGAFESAAGATPSCE